MALKKVITANNGVQTEYHKITNIVVEGKELRSFIEAGATVSDESVTVEKEVYAVDASVASYVNEDIRKESQRLAVNSNGYSFFFEIAEFEATNIFTLVYNELKKLDKFAGAEDC